MSHSPYQKRFRHIAAKMNRHMAKKMSRTQKGIGRNTRAKHQLVLSTQVQQGL